LDGAADRLKADREFMLLAAKQDHRAFRHAAEQLLADRDVCIRAVEREGLTLQPTSAETVKTDREVVLRAVDTTGMSLAFASEAFRGDRQVVLRAMAQNRTALKYASEELRNDKEIWLYNGEKAPCEDMDAMFDEAMSYFAWAKDPSTRICPKETESSDEDDD